MNRNPFSFTLNIKDESILIFLKFVLIRIRGQKYCDLSYFLTYLWAENLFFFTIILCLITKLRMKTFFFNSFWLQLGVKNILIHETFDFWTEVLRLHCLWQLWKLLLFFIKFWLPLEVKNILTFQVFDAFFNRNFCFILNYIMIWKQS